LEWYQLRAQLYETSVWIIEMKRLLLIILLVLSLPAFGEGWTDHYGYPLPDTENKKTIAGFSGWLLITSDPDWKEKFDSAESVLPQLTTVNEIGLGEKNATVTILTLYKNPQTDTQNRIDLTCDLKITRPDGTLSSDETWRMSGGSSMKPKKREARRRPRPAEPMWRCTISAPSTGLNPRQRRPNSRQRSW
jgi:hypothetical protein